MSNPLNQFSASSRLPWLWALLSLPLAIWMMVQSYGSINVDGILYIEVARKFDAGEWRQGLELYNWPFYPLLMMLVHKLGNLGFEMSAHLLDMMFFAALTAGLLTLVREVGGDRPAMIAAGVLLFVSSSIVRTYLPMVLRDPGFWAFHLWSIVFFLRFYRSQRWSNALGWGITAAVAALFRVEGLTYLAVLPLLILFQRQNTDRAMSYIKMNLLLILAGCGLLIAWLLHPALDLQKMGRLGDPLLLLQGAYEQLAHGLLEKARLYGNTVLGKFISAYGMDGLLLTLIYILVAKISTSAGWLHLLLAGYARKYLESEKLPKFQNVFAWLIAIGTTHAAFMLLSSFLLPKRYLMPIGFVIIVYAAFGLAGLYRTWHQKPWHLLSDNWKFPLVAAILGIQFGMMVGVWNKEKTDELDAAKWMISHAASGSRIYADSPRLRYYADASQPFRRGMVLMEEIQQVFSTREAAQYDYLMVHADGERRELTDFLSRQPALTLMTTLSHGRDSISVYRVSH
ncbi:uncharacterized protein NMK_0954 [Novimethylophilus kurashikiensis]|uniref:Glycosyltransferase RgtA/B/C/D-like domain-containing protein n=1 Tax=Novimethylophilus kurashikiensis TaxID=1825523 RepID=A0A2R5F4V2_9PROT|nr:glycosyltransferase family 39 protein [Novimethylophilus kurashikiensis]GBG13407.1 uncharacterized protein NMK_0954 [Novimethylophilus kurashikiensis]